MDNHTPYQAHFDSHISSYLAKLQSEEHKKYQSRVAQFEQERSRKDRIQIGDKVLLRTKTRSFQKLSSVFNPYFSEQVYSVHSIDRRVLPWLYRLNEVSDGRRKFYAFELQKLDESYQDSSHSTNPNRSTLLVKDVIIEGTTTLRSGRSVRNRGTPIYLIERDGSSDRVPESTLRVLKSALGADAIVYSDVFNEEPKLKYIV